jgi:hypothetical protein
MVEAVPQPTIATAVETTVATVVEPVEEQRVPAAFNVNIKVDLGNVVRA